MSLAGSAAKRITVRRMNAELESVGLLQPDGNVIKLKMLLEAPRVVVLGTNYKLPD